MLGRLPFEENAKLMDASSLYVSGDVSGLHVLARMKVGRFPVRRGHYEKYSSAMKRLALANGTETHGRRAYAMPAMRRLAQCAQDTCSPMEVERSTST